MITGKKYWNKYYSCSVINKADELRLTKVTGDHLDIELFCRHYWVLDILMGTEYCHKCKTTRIVPNHILMKE